MKNWTVERSGHKANTTYWLHVSNWSPACYTYSCTKAHKLYGFQPPDKLFVDTSQVFPEVIAKPKDLLYMYILWQLIPGFPNSNWDLSW